MARLSIIDNDNFQYRLMKLYDDLPPPPPPLRLSPSFPHRSHPLVNTAGEDTDNNSSIATDTTAQVSIFYPRARK
jgi:hypothetical protein